MQVLKGFGINGGSASGRLFIYRPEHPGEPAFDLFINQKEVLAAAVATSIKELEDANAASGSNADETVRMVFESHKLMAADPLLLDAAYALIDGGLDAYHAYRQAVGTTLAQFRSLTNVYMRNRMIDIIDATDRVLHALVAKAYEREFNFSEPRILLMDQMRPSVIRNCHKPHVVGFIAEYGAYDQHASMIARTKDLPGIVLSGALKILADGEHVRIDGDAGTIVLPSR